LNRLKSLKSSVFWIIDWLSGEIINK